MTTRDPLDVLFDAAARQAPPPRAPHKLEEDLARALFVANARERSQRRWGLVALAAAAIVLGVLGARAFTPSSTPDQRTEITLARGDVIWSDRATRVDVEDDGAARRVALEDGEVLFDVAPLGAGATFVVDAETAEIRVTGTIFAVLRHREALRVLVFEGEVAVDSEGTEHRLRAGQEWSHGEGPTPSEALLREGRSRAALRVARDRARDPVPDSAPAAAPHEAETAATPLEPVERVAPPEPASLPGETRPSTSERREWSVAELRHRLVAGDHRGVLADLATDARRGRDLDIDLVAADALRAARRFDEAVAEYASVAERSSPSRAAEAGYLAATVCSRSLDDPGRALAILERTHADADGSPVEEQATALRARAERALGQSAASVTARRYLSRFPGGVATREMEEMIAE